MIGHPVRRRWYERHALPPGRPDVADDAVRNLISRVAPDTDVVDLGGSDSLNLHLVDLDQVLRINKPFISRHRIHSDQVLRHQLAAHGLLVAAPIRWRNQAIFGCGIFRAQLEQYVPHRGPTTGPALFGAIGRLHRALTAVTPVPPRPMISTCVSPKTLRRWLVQNRSAGHPRISDAATFDELARLIRMLDRQWVPQRQLTNHLIHDDAHPDNVLQTAAGQLYLDFGGVSMGPRIHDLAYALAHQLFWHTGPLEKFPWAGVPDLLAAYDDQVDLPLTKVERMALAPYTAAVPVYYEVCDWNDRPVRHLARWLLENPAAITG